MGLFFSSTGIIGNAGRFESVSQLTLLGDTGERAWLKMLRASVKLKA
jgi:hypothetical protein